MNDLSPFTRYQPLITDWEAFQETIQRPLPTTVWTNPLKTTPARLSALLQDAGVPHEPVAWYPGAFRLAPEFKPGLRWEYLAGLFHVQEEVSLLPVLALDPQPGERVLDLCAAPGGKTAQIGVAMRNRGTVVANDRSVGRMRAARMTLDRLGLLNVTTTTVDGANYSKHAGQFDRVLVDVPCTCEGTCRKQLALLIQPVNSDKLVGAQTALLRKAVQLCRPGGRIVYATCTFAPEENERVVDTILQEAGDELRVRPFPLPPGFVADPGVTAWQETTFHPDLRHAVRVWPHQNDTGGFFVAVLEKVATADPAAVPAPPPISVQEERQPWLDTLGDRFGLDSAQFDRLRLFRGSSKRIYVVNDDHQPPPRPKPDAVGLQLMNTSGKYPKLATGAAMLFAPHAARNWIELDAAQLTDFIGRRMFRVTAAQLATCSGGGYVLLRYRGVWLGVGVLYTDQEDPRVQSMFPKAWSREQVAI